MTDTLVTAAAAVAVTAILCFTVLRAWRGWLEVRRLEIVQRRAPRGDTDEDVGVRIELAAVRERVKKLEAIASGVEL